MSTTLRLAQTASGSHSEIAELVAILSRDDEILIQIDSEYELVVNRGTKTNPQVRRGMYGTTPAAHNAGAAVIVVTPASGGSGVNVDNGIVPPAAVTTLVAPGAVIVGDQATILGLTKLGPFRVNFDTPGFDGGGSPQTFGDGGYVQLVGLPDGALVLGVVVDSIVAFVIDPVVSVNLNVNIQPTDDYALVSPILKSFLINSSIDTTAPTVYTTNVSFQTGSGPDGNYKSTARAISGASISVGATAGPLTAGACDVSIIIAPTVS